MALIPLFLLACGPADKTAPRPEVPTPDSASPGDTGRPDSGPGDTGAGDTGDPAPEPRPFAALGDVFAVPASAWLGVDASRAPRNPHTWYAVPAPWQDNGDDLVQPWFDLGNNSLLASIDVGGRVEYPVVRGARAGFPPGLAGEGDPATDTFLAGSPWTFSVDLGAGPVALDRLEGTSVDVLGARLFRWNHALETLAVSFIPVAPSAGPVPGLQPRALVALFRLENTGDTAITGALLPPPGPVDADQLDRLAGPATLYGPAPFAGANHPDTENWVPRFSEVGFVRPGYEAVLALGDTPWDATAGAVPFTLEPGESRVVSLGLLVGGGAAELADTRDTLRARPPIDWVNGAWGRLDQLFGTLDIPADPAVPEQLARYALIADDAFHFDGAGVLRHPRGGSWVLMGLLAPAYLRAMGLADLSVTCPPDPAALQWSLYGATLLPLIAGEAHRWGGPSAETADGTPFEEQYRCLVEGLLGAAGPDGPMLGSTRIWDGPSRGDHHTGSNIAVWFVLRAGARFAAEQWDDAATAARWEAAAAALRDTLLAENVRDTWFDDRFLEGSHTDGRLDESVLLHDAEEIMVVTAPIFGFVEPTDPRRIAHGLSAMSTANPLYVPALDAMYWAEGAPVSAPGWLTELSGATADPAELRAALARWRTRMDVDGALYWWPYDNPSTDPTAIRRRLSWGGGVPIDTPKVDYATSNALALVLHDIIGLSGDVAAGTVAFRPLGAWPAFSWTGAPMGAARFGLAYAETDGSVEATLTNTTDAIWEATVEVVVPPGAVLVGEAATGQRGGRAAVARTATLAPGDTLTVRVSHEPRAVDPCAALAWAELESAADAVGDRPELLWSDPDDDDIPEGWALRLLAEARCADSAVEASYAANLARCDTLGWGPDWSVVCAAHATVSSGLVSVVDTWNGQVLGLEAHRDARGEPLGAAGDFDGDGLDNAAEFRANGGREGDAAAFAAAAAGG